MNIDEIVERRRKLLEALEEYVENRDLKAIETYNRILSELRADLKNNEDGDGIPADIFAEIE
ncbi:hypothetical protein DRO97_11315 [Archaeoglobales archaeon]|nr:MAG: hypothetical protein DRO97_11315 [Archaeoglobales archaeon]